MSVVHPPERLDAALMDPAVRATEIRQTDRNLPTVTVAFWPTAIVRLGRMSDCCRCNPVLGYGVAHVG